MAREYAIPSSSTILQDFGLAVTTPPTARNRRVVIIGTAEDGPLYEPVIIDLPTDAELVWGRQTRGDLVRGIFECWNAQPRNQNVVGVRIGNAKKSILEIGEINSVDIDNENSDANLTALKLEARFPGPLYDQITINYDTGRAHAGDIAMYNPKTGLYSYFKVDRKNPYNTSVDVHNVAELVTAINSDRNMSSVVTASFEELETDYEIMINNTNVGVVQNTNSLRLNLQTIFSTISGFIADDTNGYIVTEPDLPYDTTVSGMLKNLTVTNNITQLLEVEGIGVSKWNKFAFEGSKTKLPKMPLDGKGTSRWDTVQALKAYSDVNPSNYAMNPSGNIVSEYLYNVDFVLIDEIPTDYMGLDQIDQFSLSIDLPFDDTENTAGPSNSGEVNAFFVRNSGTYLAYASGDYVNAKCTGITEIDTNKVGEKRPYGVVRVWVSNSIDPNGQWTELPYDINNGVYMSGFTEATAYNDAKAVFAIGPNATGCYGAGASTTYIETGIPGVKPVKWTNLTDLIDSQGHIKEGSYIRVTGNTVKGFINEVDSLSQLDVVAQGAKSPTHYFVRGQELILNASAPFSMIMNYGTRIKYEIGTTVALSDPFKGEITFNDPSNLPGPNAGQLDDLELTHIRLHYKYLPNFPEITSKAKTLHGGTTGANLTTKEREEELRKAYEYLRNFEGDIWVPMGAYIDEIKTDYNENTGLLEEMTNTFAGDIEEFLDEQSINLYQPIAVLGVTQVEGTTLGDRDKWVVNLTQPDLNDPLRGANVMNGIQNKFISVCAFEPLFLNTGRGAPYAANGQAAYAGVLSSIPYDISPCNKTISNVYALRFPFTIKQLEDLNLSRYVTMRTSDTRPPVIVNDITAAPYGSDYVNWSIFSITKEAADRIKRLADNYIGRPNSLEVRNALDQDVSNILKNMSGIQAFNFSLSSTMEQQVLGVVEIDLIIVPVFTMKKIRTTIKLRRTTSLG